MNIIIIFHWLSELTCPNYNFFFSLFIKYKKKRFAGTRWFLISNKSSGYLLLDKITAEIRIYTFKQILSFYIYNVMDDIKIEGIYLQYFAFNTNWKSFSVWYNNKKDSYLFGTGDKCEIVAGWKSVTNVATTNKTKLKLTIKTKKKKDIVRSRRYRCNAYVCELWMWIAITEPPSETKSIWCTYENGLLEQIQFEIIVYSWHRCYSIDKVNLFSLCSAF